MTNHDSDSFRFHDLDGLTVLITGITSGIGRAYLPYLLAQGLRIIAVSKGMAEMEAVAAELGASRDRLRLINCDLARPAEVAELASLLGQSKTPVDALVHNAAIDPRHWFDKGDESLWQEVMQVNLLSAVILTRHLLPALRLSRQGRIVFTGSVMSELGGACLSAYASSKGAVAGLACSLAHELQGTGITVNCLIPGAIQVEKEVSGSSGKLIDWQSVPRRLDPSDLVAPLCLLLSKWGGGISGQSLTVDGGILHPLASRAFQGESLP